MYIFLYIVTSLCSSTFAIIFAICCIFDCYEARKRSSLGLSNDKHKDISASDTWKNLSSKTETMSESANHS